MADGSSIDLNDLYTESDGKKRVARTKENDENDLGSVVECLKLKLREMQALVWSSEQRAFALEQQLEAERQTISDMDGELSQERMETKDAVAMLESMCRLPIFEERNALLDKVSESTDKIRHVLSSCSFGSAPYVGWYSCLGYVGLCAPHFLRVKNKVY